MTRVCQRERYRNAPYISREISQSKSGAKFSEGYVCYTVPISFLYDMYGSSEQVINDNKITKKTKKRQKYVHLIQALLVMVLLLP